MDVHTFLLYPIPVHSQLGPEDCNATLSLNRSDLILNAPPGTLCIQCVFNSVVASDATFQIDNTNLDPSKGRVVNGVLVVFDTESVFNTVAAIDIQCISAQGTRSGLVFLMSKSYCVMCADSSVVMMFMSLSYSFPPSYHHWGYHCQ